MEVTRALATGRRLLREHGLHDWSIVADRAKTRAGVCRFAKRQIGLSAPLTTLHSDDEVLDTILHEIAHALVGPQHGHDAVWRAKAREIGCSGERCVSSDSPRVPGDWVGRCPAGHEKTPPPRADPADVLRHLRPAVRPAAPVHLELPRPSGHPAPARTPRSSPPWPPPAARRSRSARPRSSVTSSRCRPGPWQGLVGEVELVGAVRCQVRVDDDELVSVPIDAVRVLPASAARRSRGSLL